MKNNEICIEVKCFNLKITLECGQCFRWKKVDNVNNYDQYLGIIKDRVVLIRQEENKLYITSNNMKNIEEVIIKYFDLNVDYESIEKNIIKIDYNIKNAVRNSTGLRLLNQDFFETLISYIISANNNIPRISKSIEEISKRYGEKVEFSDDFNYLFPNLENCYYLFPKLEVLKNITEEEFKSCGVGFRDKYIKNAIEKISNESISFEELNKLETFKIKEKLLEFNGIGPKVSDCILLFSFGRKEVFPIDVWVERVMKKLYFEKINENINKNMILEYANKNFSDFAGIIQEHLFYNIREKLI